MFIKEGRPFLPPQIIYVLKLICPDYFWMYFLPSLMTTPLYEAFTF